MWAGVLVAMAACEFPKPPEIADDAAVERDASIDASQLQVRSCAALRTDCGPQSNDSCCARAQIPGGSFFRGYDAAGDVLSGNQTAPATISSFALDRYEVTVGRFRAFVDAGKGILSSPPVNGDGAHPNLEGSGWDAHWNGKLPPISSVLEQSLHCDEASEPSLQTWTTGPGANENRPINCVSWYLAMAFCVWDGGYLPTSAEWDYAASGGNEQRAYPWSAPPGSLTIDPSYASYACLGDGDSRCAVTDLVPVGSKPVGISRWGVHDLVGNVAELELDYAYSDFLTPCIDCARLTTEAENRGRVMRGGMSTSATVRLRFGAESAAEGRFPYAGFRCAYSAM